MTGPAFDVEIEREFGLSHADFRRIFPRIEPEFRQLQERCVELVRADGRVLQIEISPEQVRRLASFKIPFILITFRFAGWNDEQRTEFFKKFDLAFQKGGG